jgi:hypothetical protein
MAVLLGFEVQKTRRNRHRQGTGQSQFRIDPDQGRAGSEAIVFQSEKRKTHV